MSIMSARIDSCSSAFSTGFVQKFESPRTSYSHSASPSVSHDMCAAVTSDIEVWSSGERGSAEDGDVPSDDPLRIRAEDQGGEDPEDDAHG